MNCTEESTIKQKKRTRPVFWVLLRSIRLVCLLTVACLFTFPLWGDYFWGGVGYAVETYTKYWHDLSLWSSTPGQESGSTDKYYVAAQREQGERDEQVRQSLNIIERLKASTLSDYPLTTIGSAFDAFFQEPKWELKTAGSGATFVLFSGLFERDFCWKYDLSPVSGGVAIHASIPPLWNKGDEVKVKFAITADSSKFTLWSVQIGNGVEIRSSDWERREVLKLLLEAIYRIE